MLGSKDSLDSLLKSAMAQQKNRKVKPLPEKTERVQQIRESFRAIYANPENWERKRGVALIHCSNEGAKTLLGNFSEFLHKKYKLVRKLVREPVPMLVEGEEFVTGKWWLKKDTLQRIEDHNYFEIRQTALDVDLEELQVFGKSVMLKVRLRDNWLARVELAEQTCFVCPLNSQFIWLPVGVDILDGMSLDTKKRLRQQMGL